MRAGQLARERLDECSAGRRHSLNILIYSRPRRAIEVQAGWARCARISRSCYLLRETCVARFSRSCCLLHRTWNLKPGQCPVCGRAQSSRSVCSGHRVARNNPPLTFAPVGPSPLLGGWPLLPTAGLVPGPATTWSVVASVLSFLVVALLINFCEILVRLAQGTFCTF